MTEITEAVARRVLEIVDAGLVAGLGEPVPGHMCVEAAICLALGLAHGDNPQDCTAQSLRQLKIRLNDSLHWSSPAARAKGLRALALAQLGSASVLDEREFARRLAKWTIRNVLPRALRRAAAKADAGHATALETAAQQCAAEGTQAAARSATDAANVPAAARSAAYAAARSATDAANAAARSAADAAYAAAYAANAAAYAVAYAANAANAADAAARSAADAANVPAAARSAAYAAYAAAYAANAAENPDAELTLCAEEVLAILKEMNVPGIKWLDLLTQGSHT